MPLEESERFIVADKIGRPKRPRSIQAGPRECRDPALEEAGPLAKGRPRLR